MDDYASMFRAEFPSVVRGVFLITQNREAAEDIAQEAFIQLLRHWKKVSRYERPDAWVRRVAIRLAVHHAKRERLRRVLERGQTSPLLVPETVPEITPALAALPTLQRAAVVLFYFEDRPIAEVAHILAVSPGAVKQLLHRARKRIAETFDAEVTEDVG